MNINMLVMIGLNLFYIFCMIFFALKELNEKFCLAYSSNLSIIYQLNDQRILLQVSNFVSRNNTFRGIFFWGRVNYQIINSRAHIFFRLDFYILFYSLVQYFYFLKTRSSICNCVVIHIYLIIMCTCQQVQQTGQNWPLLYFSLEVLFC